MKNLPEDELFNSLESRLRNYSEQPDDKLWSKITSELAPSREPGWIIWSDRIAAISLLLLLFTVSYSDNEFVASTSNVHADKMSAPGPLQRTISSDKNISRVESKPVTVNDVDQSKTTAFRSEKLIPITSKSGSRHSSRETISDIVAQSVTINGTHQLFPLPDETGVVTDFVVPKDQPTGGIDSVFAIAIKNDSVVTNQQAMVPAVTRRKKSGLTLYVSATPSLSFQHVTPFADDKVIFQKLNSPGVFSAERLGYGLEVGVQGRIMSRLQYVASLSFYYQSQRLTYRLLFPNEVVLEPDEKNSGYYIDPLTTEHSFRYNMINVGSQAGLLYTIKQQGLIHKAGIMLQYQQGLQQAAKGEHYNNAGSYYVSYQFVYRLEYPIHKDLHFFLQPNYSRTFIAHEKLDAPFKLKQSRAGIGMGLVFRF